MRTRSLIAILFVCGCGADRGRSGGALVDGAMPSDGAVSPSVDGSVCQAPSMPAGPEVAFAPAFAASYTAYQLGRVPGVPNPLGGVVVKEGDPLTLLVAGGSESASGAIYAVHVTRDSCNHILAFDGTATKIADTPYVDANLVYGPQALLLYTGWPQFNLAQLPANAAAPARTTDLRTLGLPDTNDSGPGGHGFVPTSVPAATGQLRVVTWPAGHWAHVSSTLNGGLFDITAVTATVTLPNNPGGFAYVPAGSPGFTNQSIIVAEWNQTDRNQDRVAIYDTDAQGDPLPSTRREFLSKFPRPWGAYFEPLTGDYLFLTWGDGDDRVYLVQGFVPPAPIF